MRYILIIFFSFLFLGSYAQETKKVTDNLDRYTKEVYYVLKNDPKIRQGAYTLYKYDDLVEKGNYTNNKKSGKWSFYNYNGLESEGFYKEDVKDSTWKFYSNGKVTSSGNFLNDEKVGVWNFYSNGEIEQTYDFSKKELIYNKPSIYEPVDRPIVIYWDNDTTTVVADRKAIFLGGSISLLKFLQKNIKYPNIARENGLEGKAIVSFWITTEGKVRDVQALKIIGGGMDEEAIRVINLMNQDYMWIPAVYQGKKVESKFVLPITFKLQ